MKVGVREKGGGVHSDPFRTSDLSDRQTANFSHEMVVNVVAGRLTAYRLLVETKRFPVNSDPFV